MARARNIKPGFYKNEDLAECSVWARYIFPGLWMLADREGRLEDRPKRIKGELLPFDSEDLEPLLRELSDKGFIVRYQIEGASYIQISKFKEHQSPHYSEKQSVIKPPIVQESKADKEIETLGTLPEDSEKTVSIKRGSQPPDSLIPDSLIPDSVLTSSASDLTTERPEKIDAPPKVETQENQKPTRAGSIACHLRNLGIDTASVRDEVIEWADKNIPDTIISEAVAMARQRKPNERISSAYLAPIVAELLNPKPKKNGEAAWWTSEKGIEAKAREVNCWPARAGESYSQLSNRIREKLEESRRESH
jgi:hypothetical protein